MQGKNMTGRALPVPARGSIGDKAWRRKLGRNMRASREAQDVPAHRIAAQMAVHFSTITHWESGRNPIAAVDLWRYAATIGVDPRDLLP